MPKKNFKSGVLIKSMLIVLSMAFFFIPDTFGRDGLKLFSIGNNSAWAEVGSWSLTTNGSACDFVPQSNDTVIIETAVIQNINFSFSDNGCLEITASGLLRGDNLNLSFSDNSALICTGVLKSNNLNFEGNSVFILNDDAKATVTNSFSNSSVQAHEINGSLSVNGSFVNSSASGITGKGTIQSTEFLGNGSVFSFPATFLVPAGSLISEINWIGTSDNNWEEAMNWAGGVLPAVSSSVAVLPSASNPLVTGVAICEDLYINDGVVFIIKPGAIVDISGDLTVSGNGKLLLQNTTFEKSSLLFDGNVSGKIQVEYPVLAGKNDLISSPVSNAVSGTFLNMYLRPYDESSSQWGAYIVPTENSLVVMQGYELFSVYNETRLFEGTPNNISKTFTISNSGNGLNLTGNPFPSYIDWENNDNNAWQRNAVAAAIYYPDPSGSGNFAVYLPDGDDAVSLNNGSRYVAPMQGFFVKAAQSGILTVNAKSCVSNITDSKVGLKNNSVKFKLKDSDGFSDEAMFRVNANSTFGFDDNLDALKLQGNNPSTSLYFGSEDDSKYAVNTIPTVNSSLEIPLDIESAKSGMLTISASGSFNFEYRYPVILEDKELGLFIDLRADSAYSFYHSPEMNSSRFIIHFNSPQAIEQTTDMVTGISVLAGEIRVAGNENDFCEAKLYTTEGKMISSAKGILSEGITLTTGSNTSSGICILQITNGKSSMTKKIFIK